jgi:hypothetical protein
VRFRVLSLLFVLASATSAYAQRDRLLVEPSPPAEWGVTFSFSPRWDIVPSGLAPLAGAERDQIKGPDGHTTLSGSTWSIGFARGRVLGADWGVSFLQTRIRRDSVIDRSLVSDCENCFTDDKRLTFRSVTAIGPEVHFYIPFFTIKERVQAGIELAGGVAHFRGHGEVDWTERSNTSPSVDTPHHLEGEVSEITDNIFYDGVPWTLVGRAEPGVAIIISPRVRVHASAGFHYPGSTYFSLKTTYFFPRPSP